MPDLPDLTVFNLDIDGPVATLRLSRPDALNALGPAFFDELPRAVDAIDANEDVRVVLLTGAGRAFCAGLDLKQMGPEILMGDADASPVQQRRALRRTIESMQDAITAVADCRVPVVAAIHGACIGGGIDLVTACDIRLAVADATFSIRETRMAMVADLGTLQRIQQIVPQGHVAELVYTGDDIDGTRAAEIGLVNHVYSDADALQDAAHDLVHRIAANSPLAVQGAKHVMKRETHASVADGLDYVALWNAAFLQSNDLGEAFQAFMEKRTPDFDGS